MTDDERVRAAAEAIRQGVFKAWRARVAQQAIEGSGYPAEVARLRGEITRMNSEVPTRSDNARLRVDLDRALDAIRTFVGWWDSGEYMPGGVIGAVGMFRAVLADYDRTVGARSGPTGTSEAFGSPIADCAAPASETEGATTREDVDDAGVTASGVSTPSVLAAHDPGEPCTKQMHGDSCVKRGPHSDHLSENGRTWQTHLAAHDQEPHDG